MSMPSSSPLAGSTEKVESDYHLDRDPAASE
jgi:hypothetical protein